MSLEDFSRSTALKHHAKEQTFVETSPASKSSVIIASGPLSNPLGIKPSSKPLIDRLQPPPRPRGALAKRMVVGSGWPLVKSVANSSKNAPQPLPPSKPVNTLQPPLPFTDIPVKQAPSGTAVKRPNGVSDVVPPPPPTVPPPTIPAPPSPKPAANKWKRVANEDFLRAVDPPLDLVNNQGTNSPKNKTIPPRTSLQCQ